MLGLTLCILTIVALLTFPPVLASIFTLNNLIRYLFIDCSVTDSNEKSLCEAVRKYGVRALLVIAMLALSSVAFFCGWIAQHKQSNHVVVASLLIGASAALIAIGGLAATLWNFEDYLLNSKFPCADNVPTPPADNMCPLSDSDKSTIRKDYKYLVALFSLTIVFASVSGVLGMYWGIYWWNHPPFKTHDTESVAGADS